MGSQKISRNAGLDALRGLASLLIIFIHRPFPGILGAIVAAIGRAAVAMFFISSGYYSFAGNEKASAKKIYKKTWNIVKILGWSLLYYFVWENFIRTFGSGIGSAVEWTAGHVINLYTWYKALIWDYDPLAGHLWFLFALVRCYLLLWLLLRISSLYKIRKALAAVCFGTVIVLEICHADLYYFRNGWFYGMGFFLSGLLMEEYGINRFNHRVFGITSLLGAVATIGESIVWPNQQMYIGTIILSISVFGFALSFTSDKMPSLCRGLARIGRDYSTLIYVIHWSLKECFIKIDKTFAFASSTWYLWISPILLAAVSILACIIIKNVLERLSAVRKNGI